MATWSFSYDTGIEFAMKSKVQIHLGHRRPALLQPLLVRRRPELLNPHGIRLFRVRCRRRWAVVAGRRSHRRLIAPLRPIGNCGRSTAHACPAHATASQGFINRVVKFEL